MTNAYSEFRDVKITFGTIAEQTALPIDAIKAATLKVQEMEYAYAQGTLTADLSDVVVPMTGSSRFKLYSFNVTTVLANGEYTFTFNEAVPNASELS